MCFEYTALLRDSAKQDTNFGGSREDPFRGIKSFMNVLLKYGARSKLMTLLRLAGLVPNSSAD